MKSGPDYLVIGDEIVRLSIARDLAQRCARVVALEKTRAFGEHTIDRNGRALRAVFYNSPDGLTKLTCVGERPATDRSLPAGELLSLGSAWNPDPLVRPQDNERFVVQGDRCSADVANPSPWIYLHAAVRRIRRGVITV